MWPDRLNALLWTCALEVPVYATLMRARWPSMRTLLATALGLQLLTQPLLWQYTGRHAAAAEVVVAEAIVMATEAVLLFGASLWLAARRPSVVRVVAAAVMANLLSWQAGILLNGLVYG